MASNSSNELEEPTNEDLDTKELYDPYFYQHIIKGRERKFVQIKDDSVPGVVSIIKSRVPASYPYRTNPLYSDNFIMRRESGHLESWTYPLDMSIKDLSLYRDMGVKIPIYTQETTKKRFGGPSRGISIKESETSPDNFQARMLLPHADRKTTINSINHNLVEEYVPDPQILSKFSPPSVLFELNLLQNVRSYDIQKQLRSFNMQRTVQVGQKGYYTPFHNDVSGGVPLFVVVEGRKIIWFVQPTSSNVSALDENSYLYVNQGDLMEKFDTVYEIVLEAGDGVCFKGIHAVYTSEDTMAFNSGMFLASSLNFQALSHRHGHGSLSSVVRDHEELILASILHIFDHLFVLINIGARAEVISGVITGIYFFLDALLSKLNGSPRSKNKSMFSGDPMKLTSIEHNRQALGYISNRMDSIVMNAECKGLQGYEMTAFGIPVFTWSLNNCSLKEDAALYAGPPFPTFILSDEFTDENLIILSSLLQRDSALFQSDSFRSVQPSAETLCCGDEKRCKSEICTMALHRNFNVMRSSVCDVRFRLRDSTWRVISYENIRVNSVIALAYGELILRSRFAHLTDDMIPVCKVGQKENRVIAYVSFRQKCNFVGLLRRSSTEPEYNCTLRPCLIGGRLEVMLITLRDIPISEELVLFGKVPRTQAQPVPQLRPSEKLILPGVIPLYQADIRSLDPDRAITLNLFEYLMLKTFHDLSYDFGTGTLSFPDIPSQPESAQPHSFGPTAENCYYNYEVYLFYKDVPYPMLLLICLDKFEARTPLIMKSVESSSPQQALLILMASDDKFDGSQMFGIVIERVRAISGVSIKPELLVLPGQELRNPFDLFDLYTTIHTHLYTSSCPTQRKDIYHGLVEEIEIASPTTIHLVPYIHAFLKRKAEEEQVNHGKVAKVMDESSPASPCRTSDIESKDKEVIVRGIIPEEEERIINLDIGVSTDMIYSLYGVYTGPHTPRWMESTAGKFSFLVRRAVEAFRVLYSFGGVSEEIGTFMPNQRNAFLYILKGAAASAETQADEKFISLSDAYAAFSDMNPPFFQTNECPICHKEFKKFINHVLQFHLRTPRFQCLHCALTFLDENKMSRHIRGCRRREGSENKGTEPVNIKQNIVEYMRALDWNFTEENDGVKWSKDESLNEDFISDAGSYLYEVSKTRKIQMELIDPGQKSHKYWIPDPITPLTEEGIRVILSAHAAHEIALRFEVDGDEIKDVADMTAVFKHFWSIKMSESMDTLKSSVKFRSPYSYAAIAQSIKPSSAYPVGYEVYSKGSDSVPETKPEVKWMCSLCDEVGRGIGGLFLKHCECTQSVRINED